MDLHRVSWAAVGMVVLALFLVGVQPSEGQRPGAKGKKNKKGPAAGAEIEYTHLNEEGFPLNVNPEIVSADEPGLDDADMVMGAVINGEARAYPVN